MASASDPRKVDIEELIRQIQALEARVHTLERKLGVEAVSTATPEGASPPEEAAPFVETARIAPLLGKALLALAGAYLLRALTENQVLPVAVGLALGIVYAGVWLVLAAHAAADDKTTSTVRGLTSVLIVVPLLWEAHMRFHALSPWVTASVLVLFSVFGLAVAWRRNLSTIAWITTMAGLVTASALLVATEDLLPFTWALLGMAVAVEISACLEHWLKERWIGAVAADLAVLLLAIIVTREGGMPESYVPISRGAAMAVQVSLLAIYLASTFVRTLWRGFTITSFEIVQCVAAFLISTWGAIRVAEGHPVAVMAVGLLTALGGAICYGVSFAFLEPHHRTDRNFYTYASFGLLLALVGSRLLLSGTPLVLLWSVLGVVSVGIGREAGRMMLKWHGATYLGLAMLASGFAGEVFHRFLGEAHSNAGYPGAAAWINVTAAVAAYALVLRGSSLDRNLWNHKALAAVLAMTAGWSVAGMLAGLMMPHCAVAAGKAQTDFCPTVLTAILTLSAIGLAWATTRWRHRELAWTAYLFMAVATYKLLAQDFRQGETLVIVLSLALYGGALVLLPRLLQKAKSAA